MRTKLNKEAFVAKLENRIECREKLMEYYSRVFLPTIQKYHGKVYNKRFITALRDCADELTYVSELEGNHIIIERRRERFCYTDHEYLYLMVKLVDGKRIDADASVTDQTGRAWVQNFQRSTGGLRALISDYDGYMKIAEELQEAIYKYKELPSALRENIDLHDKFYL